ncbi:MAG: HAD-IA family hydrolase [Granulicella sp.]
MTILLIAGGGFQGQGLALLARSVDGTRVLIADSLQDNIGRIIADRYVVAPPLSEQSQFADFLESLVREERVDLIFPCTDRELATLAELRPRLEAAGAKVAVSSLPLLTILADKRATYRALQREEIPAQQPQSPTPQASFPLLGKPRSGWGGRGFERLHDWGELSARGLSAKMDDYCWVPLLTEFEEFSADFALGFSQEISAITLRRRVRTSSGFAVISDSIEAADIHQICMHVATWLVANGGCGLFNVQVLRLADATCYVSDINARHGTSSGHAAAAGNDLVSFMAGLSAKPTPRHVRTIRTLEQRAIPIPLKGRAAYRGVIFDLDDTLIDHKRWLMDKMRLAVTALSCEIVPDHALAVAYSVIEEGHYEQLIDRVVERLGTTSLKERLLASYRASLPKAAAVHADVFDTLVALRRANLRIGLLTDNPPGSQRAKLSVMNEITPLLDAVVYTREVGEEKPSSTGFLRIASELGLPPSDLLMVGDNVSRDAVGAISAGYAGCMIVSRVGSRFHVDQHLLATYLPEVAARTWTSPDLRALTTACGIDISQWDSAN